MDFRIFNAPVLGFKVWGFGLRYIYHATDDDTTIFSAGNYTVSKPKTLKPRIGALKILKSIYRGLLLTKESETAAASSICT